MSSECHRRQCSCEPTKQTKKDTHTASEWASAINTNRSKTFRTIAFMCSGFCWFDVMKKWHRFQWNKKNRLLIPNPPTRIHSIFMQKPQSISPPCMCIYASHLHQINLHQFIIRNRGEWRKKYWWWQRNGEQKNAAREKNVGNMKKKVIENASERMFKKKHREWEIL